MQKFMSDITAISVCSNSKDLMERAYDSFRRFHSDMQLIIIDGSDKFDPCRKYVCSIASDKTTVGIFHYNIGHGRGMDSALRMAKTKYALLFDSDIVFLKSPVEQMLKLIKKDTYGVGYIELTGDDGFEYGAHAHHSHLTPTKYLHPYFMLISVEQYFKFPPFVHHGAPCFKTMNAIKQQGLSDKILIEFPGLGHSSSAGWNWTGGPREYIQHDTRGTRDIRKAKRLPEIEAGWER